jgi:hypothetical protein
MSMSHADGMPNNEEILDPNLDKNEDFFIPIKIIIIFNLLN